MIIESLLKKRYGDNWQENNDEYFFKLKTSETMARKNIIKDTLLQLSFVKFFQINFIQKLLNDFFLLAIQKLYAVFLNMLATDLNRYIKPNLRKFTLGKQIYLKNKFCGFVETRFLAISGFCMYNLFEVRQTVGPPFETKKF